MRLRHISLIFFIFVCTTLATVLPAHAASAFGVDRPIPPTGHMPVPLFQPLDIGVGVNQDIEITAFNNTTYKASVVEGWLHVDNTGKGTFIDNFGGARTYPASVDTSHIVTINTHLGRFVFDSIGNATTLPAKLGPGAQADISNSGAHTYITTMRLPFTLTPLYNYAPPVSGTIVMTIDALGVIVPFSKTIGSMSAISVPHGTKSVLSPVSAPGYWKTVMFQVKLNGKQTMLVQTGISGNTMIGIAVIVGNGAAGVIGTWSTPAP